MILFFLRRSGFTLLSLLMIGLEKCAILVSELDD